MVCRDKITFCHVNVTLNLQEFYIADAGEGQVFVIVSHHSNDTNLYVSEHKTGNMVLSLERVLYTNQASYDTISWME